MKKQPPNFKKKTEKKNPPVVGKTNQKKTSWGEQTHQWGKTPSVQPKEFKPPKKNESWMSCYMPSPIEATRGRKREKI